MNIYRIDEHHTLHVCPVDPKPHVVDIRRTVVHLTDTGPCLTPVTIGHDTGATTAVACGRHEPHERQCDNCRTVITIGRTTTSTQTGGPTVVAQAATASGMAPDPCSVCGDPLAAVLAGYGRHIGCHPQRAGSRRTRPELDVT